MNQVYASSDTHVDRVQYTTVGHKFIDPSKATIVKIKNDENDFKKRETIILTLDNAQWLNNDDFQNTTFKEMMENYMKEHSSHRKSTGFTVERCSDTTVQATVYETVYNNLDDLRMHIPMLVDLLHEGRVWVEVDSESGVISRERYRIAIALDKNMRIEIYGTYDFHDELNVDSIEIGENIPGVLPTTKSNKITMKLPNGFEWSKSGDIKAYEGLSGATGDIRIDGSILHITMDYTKAKGRDIEGYFELNGATIKATSEATPGYVTITVDGDHIDQTQVQAGYYYEDKEINFTDKNLEAVIRNKINKQEEPILWSDVMNIEELSATSANISNLEGIEYLVHLKELDLSGNKIEDLSPLSSLKQLRSLNLRCNQINNIEAICNLVNLEELCLSSNKIADISPLSSLKQLTSLNLVSNEMNSIEPIGYLVQLENLNLASNKITDISPLSSLKQLTYLQLAENEINNIEPISNLGNLRILGLYENKIIDINPLSSLKGLVSLDLSSNEINNIEPISHLVRLEILDLSDTQITDINALVKLKELSYLYLGGNKINDLQPVANLVHLKGLALARNKITDIEIVSSLKELTYLHLANNKINNIEPIKNLVQLEKLYLSDNKITDISALAPLKRLEKLYLDNNEINNIEPIKNLVQLETLGLSHNKITEISPLSSLNQLRYLYLMNNKINNIEPIRNIVHLHTTDLVEMEYPLNQSSLYRNGQKIILDQPNKLIDQHIYISPRGLAEGLGVGDESILWDGATKTISLFSEPRRVKLVIGEPHVEVNEKVIEMDVAPKIIDQRVCIPAKAVLKACGFQVSEDNKGLKVKNYGSFNDQDTSENIPPSGGGSSSEGPTGGSGGGGGPKTSKADDPVDDKTIEKALKDSKEIKVSLRDKKDDKTHISLPVLDKVIEANKPLIVENKGITLVFTNKNFSIEDLKESDKEVFLEISAKAVDKTTKDDILAKSLKNNGLFEVDSEVFELSCATVNKEKANKISHFNEPVVVTIDLSNKKLSKEEIGNLTGIRYEKDEKGNIVPVKIGGTYDMDTKTFTFYTDQFSLYGVLKADDLRKINLTIDDTYANINNTPNMLDIAPTIINNRTMVPLRFVAEALGANVEWIGETKTVKLELDDKKLNLVIGKKEVGMDVPAMIKNDRTLVPIRYVSEKLGANVLWYPSSKKIEIVK
jgi:internalin A